MIEWLTFLIGLTVFAIGHVIIGRILKRDALSKDSEVKKQ